MKSRLSKETGKIIAKNIEKDIHDITKNTVIEEKYKIEADELAVKKLSKFIYVVGIIGPILAIFQAVKIFYVQSAVGVSGIYWGAYLGVAAMWFGFGFYYKNKAIMVVYGLWIFIEIIILNGLYIYG